MRFNVSNRGVSDLRSIRFPKGVTYLSCNGNMLKDLRGCPESVISIDCWNNNLISLQGCPECVIKIDCSNNDLTNL